MNKILQALEREDSVLITDFDKTLTLAGSSLNSVGHILGKEGGFSTGRNRLFEKYGWCRTASKEHALEAYETAESWWKAQMELFLIWDVPEEALKKTAESLSPRKELIFLVKNCKKNKKFVWIVSAGLENVIQYWLEYHQISQEGIRILANRLIYEDGHPKGYGELITDWNKKEKFRAAWEKQGAKGFPVFLGDRPVDLDLWSPGISFLVGDCKGETIIQGGSKNEIDQDNRSGRTGTLS